MSQDSLYAGPAIVDFATQSTQAEETRPLPERILSGDPRQLTWNHYADSTGQFYAGVWQGEQGAWRVRYEAHEEEFCILLEGQVRLTDSSGVAREFGPGASFVVPGGFTGVWENLTRVRKAYAIGMLKEGTK